MIKKLHLAALTATFLISACSNIPTTKQPDTPVTEATANPIPKEELNGESLFQIFLAEVATNRREFGAAAALYGELGTNHNDVAAIERAYALNQAIGNTEKMDELAKKWLTLRPNDASALRAMSLSAITAGEIETGLANSEKWISADPDADMSLILPTLKGKSLDQIKQISEGLAAIQAKHPNSPSLLYTRSRVELGLSNIEGALALTNKSLKLSDNLQVNLFKFELLQLMENIPEAKKLIIDLDKRFPDNLQVAMQYARFTVRYEPSNLAVLETLHNRFSTEPSISRTYARAAFEQKEYDIAQAVYLHLLDQGISDESHYFLGHIDLINEMTDSAANHFEAVQSPPYLASALAEWISLGRPEDKARIVAALNKSKLAHPEEAATLWRLEASLYQSTGDLNLAWSTLEKGIVEFPDNIPLLYDQAMIAAPIDSPWHEVMEINLIKILELDPNHINALNALGYSWADDDKNLELAAQYIDKALEASPENPAFQDSKGWYLYRMGKLEESLTWLEKAYAQMQNDEIAAHIAEVLWHLERKDQAKKYLEEVIRLNPESLYIGYLNDLFAR